MKKLILPLLLVSIQTQAADEIVDAQDGKQIVSMVKDIEIKETLAKTQEFQSCRDKNKFDAKDTEAQKTTKIQEAEDCFRKQLQGGKSEEQLKKLSDALNLQQYGLVPSKNVKDIQNYLADKMYESLTGVNRKEADQKKLVESMKFKNKKHIDQKTFIQMYKTQLGKNALFEVSRFCFEDLRSTSSTATTFAEHWGGYTSGSMNVSNVEDNGTPKFTTTFQDASDKNKIYEDIFKSIQGSSNTPMTEQSYNAFFIDCGKIIVPLCKKFESTITVSSTSTTTSQVNVGTGSTSSTTTGSAACLAKNRIQEYKAAIGNADKLIKQFEEMQQDPKALALAMNGEPIKIYGDGSDANEKSIDDLTNYSSADMIEGGLVQDTNAEKKAEECKARPELASCEGFISDTEDFEKAKHTVEMEMTLKRTVEMERVKALKEKDEAGLKEYLEQNGYYSILEEWNNNQGLSSDELANKVGQAFEAKKIATLREINEKIGKRQVAPAANGGTATITQTQADQVVQESKEERARMGQVVLFNNIITSYLNLQSRAADGTLSSAGRNVNAWKKEEAALESSNVDPSLFANLKSSNQGVSGPQNGNMSEFSILDTFLGKPAQP